jgi:tetratricopeptide (TPR) repeat protein
MPSLLPGYEYDIFISYRQKDNKYDGWVTEFVDNLKKELEATFKEEISVYFDINPHDGLLETHDVDASLKEKLKCLVFIPIISRTYCDPKSFAWEHEFKAFVDQASRDQFGLKVKLPGGNVASRVLPIRIYDLNIADIKFCETVLGVVLRGVEFIYSEPGVNRPLKPDDDEKMNLNKTKYRNQINKVGNAIQEIISGLMIEPVTPANESIQNTEQVKHLYQQEHLPEKEKPSKFSKAKLLLGVTTLTIIIIAAVLIYPKIFKRDTLEKLRASGDRISVAVMPFQNLTNDTTWNIYQLGVQENLINYLSNFPKELLVRQTELITGLLQSKGITNYAFLTSTVAKTISQKLEADVLISGSIQQSGNKLRINAKLIDTRTEEALETFEIEGSSKEEMILEIIDSLRKKVTDFLIISKLKKQLAPDLQRMVTTNSPVAYRHYFEGMKVFAKGEYPTAINLFSQAIAADSNFTVAALYRAQAYANSYNYDQAKKLFLKIYEKRERMSEFDKLWLDYYHAYWFKMPSEVIKCVRKLLEYDDKSPVTHWLIGDQYLKSYLYDKAIPEWEIALGIFSEWGVKPLWAPYYTALGISYHKTGQYRKEKRLYKKAEQDFPDDPGIIERQTILALTKGNTKDASAYIKKWMSIRNEQSWSDAQKASRLGLIYDEAGVLDKAEEYYREALSLEPKNRARINTLSYFLIDKDRNINEGLQLIDTVLKSVPDNYNFLHTKGWGLFKQGKYKESKDIIQKSWNLRPTSIFSMQIYYHLEASKKAVVNQNQ